MDRINDLFWRILGHRRWMYLGPIVLVSGAIWVVITVVWLDVHPALFWAGVAAAIVGLALTVISYLVDSITRHLMAPTHPYA